MNGNGRINRRNFIKSSVLTGGALLVHAPMPARAMNFLSEKSEDKNDMFTNDGLVKGVCDIQRVEQEQKAKSILNYNPAMQYRPMGRTGVNVSTLGAAIYAYRHAPGHIDCTGCYQCIPCPHNVAIGYIFAYVYNNYILHRNKERAMADYTVSMSPVQRGAPASSCVSCGECLAKCPQHLDIPNLLAKVKESMGK